MTIHASMILAALDPLRLRWLLRRVPADRNRGRPWSRSRRERILITCVSLRTNVTVRELAAVFGLSKSTAHRIVSTMTRHLSNIETDAAVRSMRWSWILDGTLIPTRDHRVAARSKNDRWSCNAQIVMIRRQDLRVVATVTGTPGNRNDPVHYRGSAIEVLCKAHGRVLADGGYRGVSELVTPRFHRNRIIRDEAWRRHRDRRARVEHAIARLKDWRVLRDYRRRGTTLAESLRAITLLHNLRIELRDNS